MGHIFNHQREVDRLNYLEGLASEKAIEKCHGVQGYLLQDNDAVREIEAYYLAQAIVNYILVLSPKRIIKGSILKKAKLYLLMN